MNVIEYANIMTKEEFAGFFSSISRNYELKKIRAIDILNQNKDILIAAYQELEEAQVQKYHEEFKALRHLKNLWEEKTCDICGSKLRLVEYEYGTFWGCPNFRDKSQKHRTFPADYDDVVIEKYANLGVRIKVTWVTDILRKHSLNGRITASDLLHFFENVCYLEDLREKYGYKKSTESISGYTKAKKHSSKEEKEIIQHLTKLFPKASSQTGIRYKLEGATEKVAIIDLILSDDDSVNVIEIKRGALDIREDQLQLYHSLISFILKKSIDARICRSLFVVYNKEEFGFIIPYKYLVYGEIKAINSKDTILLQFMDKCIYTS